MNRNMNALGLVATLAVTVGLAIPANAAFLPEFEGFSVFGGDINQCALCDSTVSFAVWHNTDGDWRDDLPPATTLAAASDGTEQYVYLYQVVKTDPLSSLGGSLYAFGVTYRGQGAGLAPNPFVTGGFFANTVFDGASTAVTPLDFMNTASPSLLTTVTPLVTDSDLVEPDLLRSVFIENKGIVGTFPAMQFEWSFGNYIPADATSPVLFLTSDLAPRYRWAETESPPPGGPPGAGGDVPSTVPVPAAIWLLGSTLVGFFGVAARRMGYLRAKSIGSSAACSTPIW